MFSAICVTAPAELKKVMARKSDYSNTDMSKAIDDYIHSDRDRQILKSRLIDGLTYDELSDKYHLTSRRIKTIVYKAQEGLFKRLR